MGKPNTITIDDVQYIRADSVVQQPSDKKVSIIRTYSAGVHYGHVEEQKGKEVTLTNARRLWYWSGACSLSQLAVDGVKDPGACKFTVRVPQITLTEAIEVIPCTDKAIESIEGVVEWKK